MSYSGDAHLQVKDSYRDDARAFVRFLQQRKLDLSIESLEAYAQMLRNSTYGAQTKNKRITGAKSVLTIAFLQSPESRDSVRMFEFHQRMDEIRKSKVNTKEVPDDHMLTAEEVRRMVEDKRTSARMRLIIRTFSITGLRISELINIRLADVKTGVKSYSVRIRRGKGDKERWVKLPKDLVTQIHEVFAGEEYLFETNNHTKYDRINLTKAIARVSHRVLGKHATAHVLRHTFATHLIKQGKTVKAVSKYIGHSGTAITQDMYVHDTLELDEIIESM